MAYIELDLNEGNSDFSIPVPAGMYRVRINDSEIEYSKSEKNPGKPLVKWTLCVLSPEVVNDPISGEDVRTAGRLLFRRTPAWEGAAGFLRDLVRAAGGNLQQLGFDTADLHGREMDVLVGIKEYKGQQQSEVERFFPVSKQSELRHANPRRTPPPQRRPLKETSEDMPPPPVDEDDLPFARADRWTELPSALTKRIL